MQKIPGLLAYISFVLLILGCMNPVFAVTVTLSPASPNGPFTVKATATFPTLQRCDNSNPPVCTPCNTGWLHLYKDGSPIGSFNGSGSATVSSVFDTGSMSQGTHIFKAVAIDCLYNSEQNEKTIEIDNTPGLTVNSFEPINGPLDINGTVEFKTYGEAGPVNDGRILIYLDSIFRGEKYYEGAATWSYEEIIGSKLDAGTLYNGQHTLKIIARSKNLIDTTQSIPFIVDNTPELTVNPFEPINGPLDINGTVEFKTYGEPGSVNDGTVYVYLDSSFRGSKSFEGAASWSVEDIIGSTKFDAGNLYNGEHTLEIRATAKNYTSSVQTIKFTVDNTPELTVNSFDPINGPLDIDGIVGFKTYGEPGPVNDGTVYVYLDSRPIGDKKFEGAASWSFKDIVGYKLDAGNLYNGEHTLKIRATAKNYTSSVQSIKFTVDNTPELTVNPFDPINGPLDINGTVEFKTYGEPGPVNDGTVYIYWDPWCKGGKPFEGSASWSFEDIIGYKLDAGNLANGEHTLEITATAKNYTSSVQSIKFTVDNTPELTVNSFDPINGPDLNGTVEFKPYGEPGPVNDGTVFIYLDSSHRGNKKFEGAASWSFEDIVGYKLNAITLYPGKHTIKVMATAKNGTSTEKIRIFFIDDDDGDGILNKEDLDYLDTSLKKRGIAPDNCTINKGQNWIGK